MYVRTRADRSNGPKVLHAVGLRLFNWLTRQRESEQPEVREALLLTLPDTPGLLWLTIFWTAVPAWAAWFISHSPWAAAWVATDVVLNFWRWCLYREHADALKSQRRLPRIAMLGINGVWFVSVAAGVLVSLQIADLRTTLLGAFVAIGYLGYVVTRYSAFPLFSTLVLCLLTAALTVGLLLSELPGAFEIGLVAPAGAVAYFMLLQHNHAILLGALRAQQENRRLSLHDPLTGLPNRLHLHERLVQLCRLARANAPQASFAVMCLDLDGFKGINDRYGHSAGDWVLKSVTQRLRVAVREQDLVCRIGGDEFVIVLPGADRSIAVNVAERLKQAGAAPHDLDGAVGVYACISIGIALWSPDVIEPEALVARADDALYTVKRTAKGGWLVHGEAPARPPG